jgi:hypothetical protein
LRRLGQRRSDSKVTVIGNGVDNTRARRPCNSQAWLGRNRYLITVGATERRAFIAWDRALPHSSNEPRLHI